MKWQDKGIILCIIPFSERDVRVTVLTAAHGRQSGLYKLPSSKSKTTEVLHMGDFVTLSWNARLEEHLGRFSIERTYSPAPLLFHSSWKLWILMNYCDLMNVLPLAQAYPLLFMRLAQDLSLLTEEKNILAFARMSLFEKATLAQLGFGLDLSCCCVSHSVVDLCYISPKTARAVSKEGAGEYVARLLPLPDFWLTLTQAENVSDRSEGFLDELSDSLVECITWESVNQALAVMTYFWQKWVFDEKKTFCPARDSLVRYAREAQLKFLFV